MPDANRTSVITGFLTRGDELLLLRRSSLVGTYRGFWAGVSGYLERDDALEQAWVELKEELGIGPNEVELKASGKPLEVDDLKAGRNWLVHPFRFALRTSKELELDWEHVEMRWILPEEMSNLETVPGLWEAWERVS